MNTEERQKYTDAERQRHDRRVEDRERFSDSLWDFATDITREHALAIAKTPPLFLPPDLKDPMIRSAEIDEVFSEGRRHRNLQPNRKGP